MNFQKAEFLTSYGLAEQLPLSAGPEIVFAGRSNVGKSSAINKLLNRKKLARVSSAPGKTATINFYGIEGTYLVDLPGYGYAKTAKTEKQRWADLIEGYFAQERDIRLVIVLIDMRHPPQELDLQMVDFLIDRGFPFLILLTKSDKLKVKEKAERLAKIRSELPCGEQVSILPFSSETGVGVSELQKTISSLCETKE